MARIDKIRKLAFWCWSFVIGFCAIYLGTTLLHGYQFDSSIMTLLPKNEQSVTESLATEHLVKASDHRLVFLLESNHKSRSKDAANNFVSALTDNQLFTNVQGEITESPSHTWQQFYHPHRYQLLSEINRKQLQNNDSSLMNESLGRLYSPLASLVAPQLIDDPLQLFFQWQLAVLPPLPFVIEDGWLTRTIGQRHYRLISVELAENPYSITYQQQVMAAISKAKTTLPSDIQVLSSGLILHTSHGAKQAIGEISTIGLGSVIGILILLFTCFRRASTVLLAFLPIGVGCGFALTLSLILFDKVHLITLAFGAGLVGVAIDYSLHFLCAHHSVKNGDNHSRSPHILRLILPSLTMGLVSSVLAYAAQGMAPFPGLRQMAVFSALGLIGAWLTVVCWLPVLHGGKPVFLNPQLIALLRHWQAHWPKIDSPGVKVSLLVLVGILLIIVATIESNDDIRLLQTSTPELLNEDIAVQRLLMAPSPAQFVTLTASNQEALLQLEETFATKLYLAMDEKLISGFMSTSQYLPSEHRQRANNLLLGEKVYSEQGQLQQLIDKGSLSSLGGPARQAYVNSPLPPLQLNNWLKSDISKIAAHLWIGEQGDQYYSLITLFGIADIDAIKRLSAMTEPFDGIEFVDRIAGISLLLSNYREQLIQWLVLAYGLVLALATFRYGTQAWRVIAAPALASLIVLSLLQIAGAPITIFHGLALLLVLGIGLDASIFLQDSNNSPHTWLAVTLSSLTSLLAFGLLALSSTPVLHYFGVTVLLGIICVWVLAPCFIIAHIKSTPSQVKDNKTL